MIFKNKKLKTAMAMMAILSIFGGSVTSTYANEINENKNIVSFRKSEKYKLNTVLKHETKEVPSCGTYAERLAIETWRAIDET